MNSIIWRKILECFHQNFIKRHWYLGWHVGE